MGLQWVSGTVFLGIHLIVNIQWVNSYRSLSHLAFHGTQVTRHKTSLALYTILI